MSEGPAAGVMPCESCRPGARMPYSPTALLFEEGGESLFERKGLRFRILRFTTRLSYFVCRDGTSGDRTDRRWMTWGQAARR